MADEDHPERRVGARRVRVTHIEAWIIAGIAIVAGIGAAVAPMLILLTFAAVVAALAARLFRWDKTAA